MPVAESLSLRIEFDLGTTPVSGRLAAGLGPPTSFSGWTELFAALQTAVAEKAAKGCMQESTRDPEAT